ncbi:hypothetical protein AQ505_20680 [Pedobacter sp. PACM 27299]|nr:hypothetical protein AQ505_20680 [Pedobacter sp. PACM 27299]
MNDEINIVKVHRLFLWFSKHNDAYLHQYTIKSIHLDIYISKNNPQLDLKTTQNILHNVEAAYEINYLNHSLFLAAANFEHKKARTF